MVVTPSDELGDLITAFASQRLLEANYVGIEPLDPRADLLGAPLVGTRVVPEVECEDGEGQDAVAPDSPASSGFFAGRFAPGWLESEDRPSRPSDCASSAWARESMA
jgi:hypothetical protein